MSTPESPSIVAPAGGTGGAAVGILRLSGGHCHRLLARCLGAGFPAWPERRLRVARFLDPATGEILDQVMAVRMAAPATFTGEDMAEVHCHGGPYVVRRLLEALYQAGFRAAEPGEFTRRAFLHGKMDLTEAEGIRELVEAESHQQWLAARQLASGRLKAEIETLRDQLLAALAVLEAQIDFPDEGDTGHLNLKAAVDAAAAVSHTVKKLLSTFDSGRVASRGLAVALFGAPNSGKSTLLNTLLGHERAIVSDIPGTTRDWIEEKCLLDGRLVRLVDMAGVRDTVDPIEAIGVGKARELAAEADLTVALIAADAPPGSLAQIRQWLAALNASTTMIVLTKADLGRPEWAGNLTSISCRTGAGLREFRQDLVARVDALVGGLDRAAPFITAARHADALKKALASLDRFGDSERRGEYTECLAFELQEAARALRAVIGEVDREDVLDRIFSTFCIGK